MVTLSGQNRLVNLSDYAAFRSTYGMRRGEDGYRAELDYDGNGIVNLSDFARFRPHGTASVLVSNDRTSRPRHV